MDNLFHQEKAFYITFNLDEKVSFMFFVLSAHTSIVFPKLYSRSCLYIQGGLGFTARHGTRVYCTTLHCTGLHSIALQTDVVITEYCTLGTLC